MNEYLPLLIILFVSFIASTLTFFSGFGLGTLLLPAFALFVPLELAIAMTALVHFSNNILKVFLVYATIDRKLLLRFGGAALIGSALGALLLRLIDDFGVCYHLTFFEKTHEVSYIGLIVGVLMLLFAVVEYIPKLSLKSISLTLGGLISGFFLTTCLMFVGGCGLTDVPLKGSHVAICHLASLHTDPPINSSDKRCSCCQWSSWLSGFGTNCSSRSRFTGSRDRPNIRGPDSWNCIWINFGSHNFCPLHLGGNSRCTCFCK